MPVEIMELVVKATITEEKAEKENHPVQQQISQILDKKALMQDLVEQVLEILNQQKER